MISFFSLSQAKESDDQQHEQQTTEATQNEQQTTEATQNEQQTTEDQQAEHSDMTAFTVKAVDKDSNNTFAIMAKMSDKASVLGKAVAKATGITEGFRLFVAGKEVYPCEMWRSINEYEQGLKSTGYKVIMTMGLAGGGPKRTRSSTGTKEGEQIPVVYTPPTAQANDIAVVANALKINHVDIMKWFDTMTIERLRDLHERYESCVKVSSHTDKHINMMMSFVGEYNDLVATWS